MAVDHIRYDILAQDALRTVVRRVLSDAAKNGLPGEHYFYISFNTGAEGVRISPRLREQYPQEMTIILQHQFRDLSVTDTAFTVALWFDGIAERLTVPFAAISGFFDPSVQFGLQFEAAAEGAEGKPRPKPVAPAAEGSSHLPASAGTPNPPGLPPVPSLVPETKPAQQAENPEPGPDSGGAQVVRLDRFRKK